MKTLAYCSLCLQQQITDFHALHTMPVFYAATSLISIPFQKYNAHNLNFLYFIKFFRLVIHDKFPLLRFLSCFSRRCRVAVVALSLWSFISDYEYELRNLVRLEEMILSR